MREERNRRKTESVAEAKNLVALLIRHLHDCGLDKKKLSQFSGLELATVSKILKGYNKGMNITTFSSLAKAAGYKIELVPMDPREDVFRQERRLPPPPIDD